MIPDCRPTDAGRYVCTITLITGAQAQSTATLTIDTRPAGRARDVTRTAVPDLHVSVALLLMLLCVFCSCCTDGSDHAGTSDRHAGQNRHHHVYDDRYAAAERHVAANRRRFERQSPHHWQHTAHLASDAQRPRAVRVSRREHGGRE